MFIIKDIKKGEVLTGENLGSIQPEYGAHLKFYGQILVEKVDRDLNKGTSFDIKFLMQK